MCFIDTQLQQTEKKGVKKSRIKSPTKAITDHHQGPPSGDSAFSYYTSQSWNHLPEEIRCAPTVVTFKSRFKTHLFSCVFNE